MAQNVFMVQTCLLILLKRLSKTYHKCFTKGKGLLVRHFFSENKDETLCWHIHRGKHVSYFRSFLRYSCNYVFHKLVVEVYVLSFNQRRMNCHKNSFVIMDKCFSERYSQSATRCTLLFSTSLCTQRDLIYWQKAYYEKYDNQKLKSFLCPSQSLEEQSYKNG